MSTKFALVTVTAIVVPAMLFAVQAVGRRFHAAVTRSRARKAKHRVVTAT